VRRPVGTAGTQPPGGRRSAVSIWLAPWMRKADGGMTADPTG
jgi:hypothetical protein